MSKKVVVGMSGGVDSSVAAYLLKKQGYDVIGVTMQMLPNQGEASDSNAVDDARMVAETIGIPFYVMDFTKEFRRCVINPFVDDYLHGNTPNPCVVCNRYVKWEALLDRCKEFDAQYLATGHYARITQLDNGRYVIRNSLTARKDQTYALYNLTQQQLSHTMMPVGEYEKDVIREIATEIGLNVAAKPDSQDICFVPDNDYASVVFKEANGNVPGPGNFVTMDGKIIGQHKGIIHYTVGQRKGLNLAMGHPVFVTEVRPETNEVVIGENEDVFSSTLFCNKVNLMAVEDIDEPVEVMAKVRYAHAGSPCVIEKVENDKLQVTFKEPVRAITPGQAVVFYQNDYVFGGATIIR